MKLEAAYTMTPDKSKGSSDESSGAQGMWVPLNEFIPKREVDTREEPKTPKASGGEYGSPDSKSTKRKMTCKKKKPENLTAEEIAAKVAEGMKRRAAEKKKSKAIKREGNVSEKVLLL